MALTLMPAAIPKAGAQTLDEATMDRARAIWAEALTNYDAGNFEQALAGFREVYDLTNRPGALLNMAQCYYHLGDAANAMTYFHRAVRAMGSDMHQETAADVAEKIRSLRNQVARLTIEVNVDDATVEVNGVRVGRSPLPDPVFVVPGNVVVRASLPTGETAEERVAARAGREVEVSLTLPAPSQEQPPAPVEEPVAPPRPVPPPLGPGRLTVRCNVPGATVTVDGELAGQAPIEKEYAVGSYEVRVTADGYEPYVRTVAIVADQETALDVQLVPVPEGLDPIWFWVGVGTTALFAATTVGLGLTAAYHNAEAEDYLDQMRTLTTIGTLQCEPYPPDDRECWEPIVASIEREKERHADTNDTANGFEIGTWVMLGVTLAAAGATTWLLLESAPLFAGSGTDFAVAPVPTEGGIGLGAWGTF